MTGFLDGDLTRLLDWRAPVEIVLIALGLYLLYRNLSAMGAWKIVVGIFIGIGVFVFARFLGLRGIEWILSHFVGVALIAVIVLFQPEIRRIFARAASFRRPEAGSRQPTLAALIADAMFDLTRRGWGAIVVVPGTESLEPWVSSGIRLEATPSFPLLVSVFDPDSPGHDGAVVIDEGKMSSFGVRLPLSKRSKLPEAYGTRHHAALGLSESTDALALVVSEERRKISAFVGGEMHEVDSREQLVRRIEDQWSRTALSGGWALTTSRRPRATMPLIGSLVVATLFWLSIVPSVDEVIEMSVPVFVEYTSVPSGLSVVGDRTERAHVLVSGEAKELSRIDPSILRVRCDLSGVVPGEQTVPLSLVDVPLPPGVRVIDLEPRSAPIQVQRLVERELPIRPQLIGEPLPGFAVVTVEVRPATLRVLVPESSTGVPTEIVTAPIHVGDVTGPTQVISTLVAPSGIRPVGERWPNVRVALTLRPAG